VRRGPGYDTISGPVYSADGAHLGFQALRQGKWILVVDGKEGTEYAKVSSLVFSPDGKAFAYPACKETNWLVVAGDQEGQGYDKVWDISFRKGGAVEYLAAKTGLLYRVKHTPVGAK
jgi:hypothetical protein